MRRILLVSVAAIALAAGGQAALSQGGPGGSKGGGPGASGSAPMANPPGPSGGAAGGVNPSAQDTPAPGSEATPGGRAKGAQDRTIPEKQQKSTQQAPAGGKPAPMQQGQTAPQQQPGKAAPTQQSQTPPTGGAKQGTAERPMTSRSVSLTTEQKTTIRRTVLTGSAPRVSGNVNFDIKIGTVVPRTVRVAPLPLTLIEIEPTWRGYMYFVYADEIIIVEPTTLRIVAVLEV